MAAHSSVLAWGIPGTAEPGGLLSRGSHRVGHDWSDAAAAEFCRPCSLSPALGSFCVLHITTVSQSPNNNSLKELEYRVEHWGQWSLLKSLSKADLSQETRTFCLTLALTPRPPPPPSVSKASLRRRPWRHFRRLGQVRPASRARGSLWPPNLRTWGGRARLFSQPTLSSGKHSPTPTPQARRGESSENLAPPGSLSAFRSSEELQGRRASTRWPHRPPVCFFCGQAGGGDQTLPSYSCLWCVCV